MSTYKDIYFGNDRSIAEKNNFKKIISSLREAEKEGEQFVLISSSKVFDRTLLRAYTEEDTPNSQDFCSKILIEAEKKVLEYKNGFVFRVQDSLNHLKDDLFDLIKKNPTQHSENGFWLLMDNIIDPLIDFIAFHEQKIVHICSPYKFSVQEILYLSNNSSCEINEQINTFGYKGRLVSDTLPNFPSCEGLMVKNKNAIESVFINKNNFFKGM